MPERKIETVCVPHTSMAWNPPSINPEISSTTEVTRFSSLWISLIPSPFHLPEELQGLEGLVLIEPLDSKAHVH